MYINVSDASVKFTIARMLFRGDSEITEDTDRPADWTSLLTDTVT